MEGVWEMACPTIRLLGLHTWQLADEDGAVSWIYRTKTGSSWRGSAQLGRKCFLIVLGHDCIVLMCNTDFLKSLITRVLWDLPVVEWNPPAKLAGKQQG